MAQLYLNDPAVAGEPPRQLKGFQKVTLKPGQSTTVHFTLSGQDLSYWDDAANGWVLPDGGFGVYVGDSSALANLPLRGRFTVDRTVGARYATLSAPATVTPGTPATANGWVLPDGTFGVDVGDSSAPANLPLHGASRSTARRGPLRHVRPGHGDAGPPATSPPPWSTTATTRCRRPGSRCRSRPAGPPAPGAGHGGARADRHRALHRDRAGRGAARRQHPAGLDQVGGSRVRRPRRRGEGDGHGDRPVLLARRRLQQHRDQRQRQPGGGRLRRGRRQLLRPGARRGHADPAHPRRPGHDRRHHAHLALGRGGDPGQRGDRRPDGRGVRVGNRPRVPRRQPERHRQRHGHGALHRRQQPVLQPQHGGLVRQQPRRRQSAPDHHLELELHLHDPDRPPGQHLLRVGAAAGGQAGVVGHAARPQQRGRHHGHAHLLDGDRNRDADNRSALLLARRRLRQRRDHRQLRPGGGRFRRHRGDASPPRRSPPARRPR